MQPIQETGRRDRKRAGANGEQGLQAVELCPQKLCTSFWERLVWIWAWDDEVVQLGAGLVGFGRYVRRTRGRVCRREVV